MNHLILEKICSKLVEDADYISYSISGFNCIINIRKSGEWCLSVSISIVEEEMVISGFMMENVKILLADPRMFEKADKHIRKCIEVSYNLVLSKLAIQEAGKRNAGC